MPVRGPIRPSPRRCRDLRQRAGQKILVQRADSDDLAVKRQATWGMSAKAVDRLWWSPCEAWRVCAVVSSPLLVVTVFWAGIHLVGSASSGLVRQERKAGGYLPLRRWVSPI
jgi:hypothetical protein